MSGPLAKPLPRNCPMGWHWVHLLDKAWGMDTLLLAILEALDSCYLPQLGSGGGGTRDS